MLSKKTLYFKYFSVRSGFRFCRALPCGSGDAEVWDLPKMGINGNSHFMFQEMNNKQIADLIENLLKERKL